MAPYTHKLKCYAPLGPPPSDRDTPGEARDGIVTESKMAKGSTVVHRNLTFIRVADPMVYKTLLNDRILKGVIIKSFDDGWLAVTRRNEAKFQDRLNTLGFCQSAKGRW